VCSARRASRSQRIAHFGLAIRAPWNDEWCVLRQMPTDLPGGLFYTPLVQPRLEKFFTSLLDKITGLSPAIPSHQRGVSRSLRTLGAGCDGRNGVRRRTALIADGEAVWS
jgi:hypothetical protein